MGRNYVVSSYPDCTTSPYVESLPSEVCIVAVEDNTTVQFTLGGNNSTETSSGLTPGEAETHLLSRGDVLSISSKSAGGDLSGSTVVANKPVAVVSANQCAKVPLATGSCDFIVEMQKPVDTWGTEFHVTALLGRDFLSYVRVYALEDNTTVYKDGEVLGVINGAPGVIDEAYIDLKISEGAPQHHIISADKPVYVSQLAVQGYEHHTIGNPFQIDLNSTEQYENELVFSTLQYDLTTPFFHYVDLVYQAHSAVIPETLEIGIEVDGDFTWQAVSDVTTIQPAHPVGSGDMWWSTTIALPQDGTYAFRSPTPISGIAYGIGGDHSYGFSVSGGTKWLRTEDLTPPDFEIVHEDAYNLHIRFTDEGGSGFGFARLDNAKSTDVVLTEYTYDASEESAHCTVEFLDAVEDDKQVAFLLSDRAGNTREIQIDRAGCTSHVRHLEGVGEVQALTTTRSHSHDFVVSLTNPLETPITFDNVQVRSHGYSIHEENLVVAANSTGILHVYFQNDIAHKGTYGGTLFGTDACGVEWSLAEFSVTVEVGTLETPDGLELRTSSVSEVQKETLLLFAKDSIPVTIYDVELHSAIGDFVLGIDKSMFPIEISDDMFVDVPITFAPKSPDISWASLVIHSDAQVPEKEISLRGVVLPTSVAEDMKQQGLELAISPHPADNNTVVSITSTTMRNLVLRYADVQGVVQFEEHREVGTGTMSNPLPDHLHAGRWTLLLETSESVHAIPFIVK